MNFRPQPKGGTFKPNVATEKQLDDVHSLYIRVRDSDDNGVCACFTCGKPLHFRYDAQCGHGLSRRYYGTRYHEKNNHAQCVTCNIVLRGNIKSYMFQVNKKYGPDTWDELMSLRDGKKLSGIERYEQIQIFRKLTREMAKEKGLKL